MKLVYVLLAQTLVSSWHAWAEAPCNTGTFAQRAACTQAYDMGFSRGYNKGHDVGGASAKSEIQRLTSKNDYTNKSLLVCRGSLTTMQQDLLTARQTCSKTLDEATRRHQEAMSAAEKRYEALLREAQAVFARDLAVAREAAYRNGFRAGDAEGYARGNNEGYKKGHIEGYRKGRTEGYAKGYDDGRLGCERLAYLSGYDINLDGRADKLDGIIIMRKLFGFTGESLIEDHTDEETGEVWHIMHAGARRNIDEIEEHLGILASVNAFDVDGDGAAGALQDGLVILRWFLGFAGSGLTNDAIDAQFAPRAQKVMKSCTKVNAQ